VGTAVIACCDASPVLQFAKHIFDFVALFVEFLVVLYFYFSVLLRRDTWRDTFMTQSLSEPIRIIPTISKKVF